MLNEALDILRKKTLFPGEELHTAYRGGRTYE
jgi:hypothetical protein